MSVHIDENYNIIGIEYTNKGGINTNDFELIIEDNLEIPEDEISAIDKLSNHFFLFQISNTNTYDRIVDQFAGQSHWLNDETEIKIIDMTPRHTSVEIKDIPFNISKKVVEYALSKYGIVHRLKYHELQGVKYFKNRQTGRMNAMMTIRDNIPSSIYIKDGERGGYIYLRYYNQILTCTGCGQDDHRFRHCNVTPGAGTNVVDLNEKETLEEVNTTKNSLTTEPESSENHDVKTKNPVQINNPVSNQPSAVSISSEIVQSEKLTDDNTTENSPEASENMKIVTNSPECEYVGAAEKAAVIHRQPHTGEKTIKCKECNMAPDNKENANKEFNAHSEKTEFKCSECDIKNNDIQNLEKHTEEKKHSGKKKLQTFADVAKKVNIPNNQNKKHSMHLRKQTQEVSSTR